MSNVNEQNNSGLGKRKREDVDKQTLRKIKNRQSAQESRDKQKLYIKTLETTNASLLKSNELLVSSVEQLKLQNKDLLEKFTAIMGLLNSANSSNSIPAATYNGATVVRTQVSTAEAVDQGNSQVSFLESLFALPSPTVTNTTSTGDTNLSSYLQSCSEVASVSSETLPSSTTTSDLIPETIPQATSDANLEVSQVDLWETLFALPSPSVTYTSSVVDSSVSTVCQSPTDSSCEMKSPDSLGAITELDTSKFFTFDEPDLYSTPQTAPTYPTFKLPVPSLDMKSDPEVVESPKQILSTEMYLTLDILIRCFPMMLFAHCNQRIICQPLKLETTFPVFGNRIFKFGPSFQKRFPICHELLNPK